MILIYTRRSAPRGSPNMLPRVLSIPGKNVNTSNHPPTQRNTRKWSALKRLLLAISSATRNIVNPDVIKKIWRRFMDIVFLWLKKCDRYYVAGTGTIAPLEFVHSPMYCHASTFCHDGKLQYIISIVGTLGFFS